MMSHCPWLLFVSPLLGMAWTAAAAGAAACAVNTEPRSARLIIECPAEVEVWFDEARTRQTGPLRRFHTPPLAVGETYAYTVSLRRGNQVLARREVRFRAGETVRLHLTLPHETPPRLAAAQPPSPFMPTQPALSPVPPSPPPTPSPATPQVNFGVDLDRWLPEQGEESRHWFNGRSISRQEARWLLQQPPPLPDHGRQRRLTIIGSIEQHHQAATLLRTVLASLVEDYLVKMYLPTDWAVAQAGFKTDGQPTVYAQEPDGRVLFRQDALDGLELNLAAVRKPRSDYQPDRDPDYRQAHAGWGPMMAVSISLILLFLAWRRESVS